jgi:hypothetical protein
MLLSIIDDARCRNVTHATAIEKIEVTDDMVAAGMNEYVIRWPDLADADDNAARYAD